MRKRILFLLLLLCFSSFTYALTNDDVPTEIELNTAGYFLNDLFNDSSLDASLWEAGDPVAVESNGKVSVNGLSTDKFGTIKGFNPDKDFCFMYTISTDNGFDGTVAELDNNYAYNGSAGTVVNFFSGTAVDLNMDTAGDLTAGGGYDPVAWDWGTNVNHTFRLCWEVSSKIMNATIWVQDSLDFNNYSTSFYSSSQLWTIFKNSGTSTVNIHWFVGWNGTEEDAPYISGTKFPVFNSPAINPQTNNTQIFFNISCAEPTDDIILYFNQTGTFNRITNNSNEVFWQTNVTQEQSYGYIASCETGANSSIRTWSYDVTNPEITINPNNFFASNNSTAISRLDANKNMNFTLVDNSALFGYLINITKKGTSEVFYNITNETLSGTTETIVQFINYTNWDLGNYTVEITASDSHTATRINDYEVRKLNSRLEYNTDEGNNINIYTADSSIVDTQRTLDRYSFSFSFTDRQTRNRVFYVSADKKIVYLKNSKYKAHFVVWNKRTKQGNWIDFEGIPGRPTINKINDLLYSVSFNTVQSDIIFNSIGGLNVNTQFYQFELATLFPFNPKIYLADKLQFNFSGEYNLKQNVTYNETFINELLNDNCNCTGCLNITNEITDDTCRIPVIFSSDGVGLMNVSIINSSYEYGIDNCSVFTYPVLNFFYKDEITGLPIIATTAYDLDFVGLFSQGVNGSFSGQNNNSFCSNINGSKRQLNWDVTGQTTVSKDEYATRLFDITTAILADNLFPVITNFNLIRLNESSSVVFSWLTTAFQPVTGTMNIFRCEGDGTKTFVSGVPIIDGTAQASIELLSVAYSYEVVIGSTTFTDEESYTKCHIESGQGTLTTPIRFFVQLPGEDLPAVVGLYQISCNLTKSAANKFNMIWSTNPSSSETITGCIKAVAPTITNYTTFFEECSSNFVLNSTIPTVNVPFTVTGTLFQGGFSVPCDQNLEGNVDSNTAGLLDLLGIFSVALLIIAGAFFFAADGEGMVLGSIIGLLAAWFLGLLAFGWAVISSILVIELVIIAIGRYSRQQ